MSLTPGIKLKGTLPVERALISIRARILEILLISLKLLYFLHLLQVHLPNMLQLLLRNVELLLGAEAV